ncbi:uncharacterized protein C8A04DRAFT_14677 [Dichotomopilus funicola]|uniref:F-box domain-containing protein n=1 Tax=Dichotomopilus funicola TaxID=1934379 RepID=A0AAN6ZKI8_9PEZI|nr:hypothetical protein C8A04DRAFT_14677 [Dichotomopilus funicola]
MDHICLRLRELRFLVPAYRRRLSAQKRCTLNIPSELVDMILKHLPPESAIAFALTCRGLFFKHFPKSAAAQLSAPSRETLLQWLEQDNPRLYFCHGCACLHRWRATLKYNCFKTYDGPCWWNRDRRDRGRVMRQCVSTLSLNLTYSWARLVTNRYLYGALHGPPLQDIEVTHRIPFCSEIVTTFWRAKIIGNNLYLRGTMVIQGDGERGTARSLRAFIRLFQDSLVCRHFKASIISELGGDEECSSPFRLTSGTKIRSSPVCFTDYYIRVALRDFPTLSRIIRKFGSKLNQRRPSEREEWSIEVIRWHNLGQCRSPHDPEWHNLVNRSSRTSRTREDMCGAGMIHKLWREAEVQEREREIETGRGKRCEAGKLQKAQVTEWQLYKENLERDGGIIDQEPWYAWRRVGCLMYSLHTLD